MLDQVAGFWKEAMESMEEGKRYWIYIDPEE